MYPDIEYIMRRRYALSLILRCFVILLFLIGALPVVQVLVQGFMGLMYYLFSIQSYPSSADWKNVPLYILPETGKYALPALVMLMYRQRIVRWIAPMPKPECPHCGYNIAKLAEPRCPECGMELPGELVDQADSD